MSIIINLSNNLELYEFSDVNDKAVLIDSIAQGDRHLDLFDKFQSFWQKNWQSINGQDKLYFVIQPSAGFTDTRIVYIWIKSLEMFLEDKQVYICKVKDQINIDELNGNELEDIINNSQDGLQYSQEPRIGIK